MIARLSQPASLKSDLVAKFRPKHPFRAQNAKISAVSTPILTAKAEFFSHFSSSFRKISGKRLKALENARNLRTNIRVAADRVPQRDPWRRRALGRSRSRRRRGGSRSLPGGARGAPERRAPSLSLFFSRACPPRLSRKAATEMYFLMQIV